MDVLEKRYEHPGLNLTNDTREGILKHTTWRRDFPFPDVDAEGLNLSSGGHLEGQAVAWADEYAQQAHDLEDGLKLVDFEKVLGAPDREGRRRGARTRLDGRDGPARCAQAMLIRGMIHLLVTDLITSSRTAIGKWLEAKSVTTPDEFYAQRRKLPGLPRRAVEGGRALLRRAQGVHLPAHHPQPPRRAARRARAARRLDALRARGSGTRGSCPTTSSSGTATSRA